ncbi:MAG: DUF2723 domain-containing protein [Gemmatimonadota bacterium]|nr:DUF2723 domain-containing protein [Gemmatimonadota bacterium]
MAGIDAAPASFSTMTAKHEVSERLDYRPSYLAAAIASAAVLLLYIVTLSPSTAMWDTSEYMAAAYTLGLPHPPGNPFFILVARVFSILPIAPNVAMRINLLAAVSSAVSAGMWFLITERVLVGWLAERWQRITGGAVAALLGATMFTVWSQSVVNEKVYTVSLLGLALVSWLTVRWCDSPDGRKADRILVLIAYISGLGYANHMAGFLALPAVAVAVMIRRPATLIRWRLLLAIAGALLLGMTPFLTQPIRSAYFPPINEGETTGCATKIGADCTFSKVTYDRFMYNFNRKQFDKPALTERQVPFTAQVGMWWLYFKWQFLRDPGQAHGGMQNTLAFIFLILGGLGGYVHWKRDRRSFTYFGPLMLMVTLILIYYMNFKYGWSQSPELGDAVPREVRDRDYFYLWGFSAWSVWAALGLTFIWETAAALIRSEKVRVGNETLELPTRQSWLIGAPVLAFAVLPLFANWTASSRAGQTDTRDFAHDVLDSVEPYGIIVTGGDNDTFPLWYAQEVEGIRKDVFVACLSLLNTDWYPRQMIRRPIADYDAAKGPAIYRNRIWKKPAQPPVHFSFSESDAVPNVVPLPGPMTFQKPGSALILNVTGKPYGDQHILERADLFVLYMIRDAFPERPIYISRTTGSYADMLGLSPYLVTTGLARKLVASAPDSSSGFTPVRGEGWVDLATTRALWENDFEAPKSLARHDPWVDRASVGIPYLYVRTGALLSGLLGSRGLTAEARTVLQQTQAIAKASGLEDVLAGR